jgi:phosphoribosylformylglycinamidine cyclo-ligase
MAEPASKGSAPRDAYVRAGVDVAAGDRAVELMRSAVESTHRPEVVGSIGGFAGAIAVPARYRQPLIVSSTDGVGTKTAIAAALHRWDTVGVDLVAMCADDVVCTGAEPLAFLDYIAVGRIEPEAVAELVGGVAEGCRQAGCALVGGETAEHPGLMEAGTFDLAGTCLGVVERDELLNASTAQAGDLILGLPSSGLHSNGFTLVRALLTRYEIPLERPYLEQLTLSLGDAGREAASTLEPQVAFATVGEVLLTPTRIYSRTVLDVRAAVRGGGADLRGVAHITGGGLPGNVPRALPAGLGARLDPSRWPIPSSIGLMAALAGIDGPELRATFNGGIGMAMVLEAAALPAAMQAAPDAIVIGEVTPVATIGGRYAEGTLEWSGAVHP